MDLLRKLWGTSWGCNTRVFTGKPLPSVEASMYLYVQLSWKNLRVASALLVISHYKRNNCLAHHTSPFKHIIVESFFMVCQTKNENNIDFRGDESGTLRLQKKTYGNRTPLILIASKIWHAISLAEHIIFISENFEKNRKSYRWSNGEKTSKYCGKSLNFSPTVTILSLLAQWMYYWLS